jgi:FAD/FMN-containing dehydrogenase
MSTTPPVDAEAARTLGAELTGDVLVPTHGEYEDARRVHNGLIDRRPAIIARCGSAADVAAAVRFATANRLEISVRGGGHNVAGRAVVDDGMMIDLSGMRTVTVDPDAQTARVGGGALWSDVNAATAEHGLAVTGGAISNTGVGGYTLGGGLGWLMSTQGLAADNLVGVELVTAAGEVLDVSDETHPDLMWALRGGGGNFGVAASFTFRLRPQPMVVGGMIAHPVDAAADVLRFYRDQSARCSDELTVFAALAHTPDGSGTKIAA